MYTGKRVLDVSISLFSLPFVIPTLCVCWALIFVLSGKNPIFRQIRPGYLEKPFTIYKLRTLFPSKKEYGQAIRFGRCLRKYSIDELPQFYNVLIGDMSLVGPRPLLCEYLSLYSDIQKLRHLTKPGITGLAQINSRNNLDWNKRFEQDVRYQKNQSLILDIKILSKTIYKVFKTNDVVAEGLSDLQKFKGNN